MKRWKLSFTIPLKIILHIVADFISDHSYFESLGRLKIELEHYIYGGKFGGLYWWFTNFFQNLLNEIKIILQSHIELKKYVIDFCL